MPIKTNSLLRSLIVSYEGGLINSRNSWREKKTEERNSNTSVAL